MTVFMKRRHINKVSSGRKWKLPRRKVWRDFRVELFSCLSRKYVTCNEDWKWFTAGLSW